MQRLTSNFERSNSATLDSQLIKKAIDHVDQKTYTNRLKRNIYRIEPDGLYKRCSKCKDYWPADSEFFYSAQCNRDGLHAWCKACYLEWRYPNGRKSKNNTLSNLSHSI